jgi:hypothetical protein
MGPRMQTSAATCTAAGEETRVCALDAAHKETLKIDKLVEPSTVESGVAFCKRLVWNHSRKN